MNLNLINLKTFLKDVKRLYKKYKKLPDDLRTLSKQLNSNPKTGISLGCNCYKIRLVNSSVPFGKSGGFRIVYYYDDGKKDLYLMTMFSKRDMENINNDKIIGLLKKHDLT